LLTGRRLPIAAFLTAVVAAGGVVWAGQRGSTSKAPAGEYVKAERGSVSVTVGGIGHITTLSGAARLAVPPASSSAGSGSASASPSASGGGGSPAPADAVFASVPGHVARLNVRVGQYVSAGEAVATLSDDGTLATQELQARSDLGTARIELAQKQFQDPVRGPQPTPAEIVANRQAVLTARDKLHRVLGRPLPADVATARSELAKAVADLKSARSGTPAAVSAAELAVLAAQQKLRAVTGSPDAADVAIAQLELARATLDQETLLRVPGGPTALARAAADAAVALAQQHLSDAQSSGTAADVAAARAELAKAEADREALLQPALAPSAAAQRAAQLAVDAAQRRVDALTKPPAAIVTAARQDLARAEADLAALRTARGSIGLATARTVVIAAKRRLSQLRHPPREVVSTARLDLRKAEADLAVLRQRGSPATPNDIALARLKVNVGSQRLALAQQMTDRLIVRAPASGTVTSVLTTPGAAVDAVTPVARVQDLNHLVVSLDLSEFDVGRTRVGARARVNVDSLGGRSFRGRVVDVALSGSDNGSIVNFPITIAVRAPKDLRPGMSVSARVIVREQRGVVRVPLAAIKRVGANSTVTVRKRPGVLERRVVKLGLAGTHSVEVRSGLRPGESIFVPTSGV
jgi:HlyD family secretion protein